MSSEYASSYFHPHVSWFRQLLNFIGCLIIFPLYRAAAVNTYYPATVDLLISILLAEFCRYQNEGRRIAFHEGEAQPTRFKDDIEKHATRAPGGHGASNGNTMAAIVGWREDADLWTRCLESYKSTRGCRFTLVGIDGHDPDDQEMIDIFKKVYPQQSLVIHLDEPLGEVANAVRAREIAVRRKLGAVIDDDDINEIAMQTCIAIARNKLEEHLGDLAVAMAGPDGLRHLLVNQRHLHKKGIMFTVFVFSTIIADLLGLEFVWSSDSDTIVLSDSLEGTINTIAGDPMVGGASSGLVVHNSAETVITRLASTIYWLPWYNQRVFGKKMIINEDRHLTTLLLLRGWGIVYAGDVMTETETPTTVARWIRQQVRWARAQHIESLLLPRVYIVNHPFLFLSALRRELAHLVVFVQGLLYLFADRSLLSFNMPDLGLRLLGIAVYNFLRNPDRQSAGAVLWMVPGLLFYNVPLPAVQAWSLVTLTADTWGSSMRSSSERAKKDSLGKKWFESGFIVVWMGAVGAMLGKWMCARVDLLSQHILLTELLAAACSILITWKMTIKNA